MQYAVSDGDVGDESHSSRTVLLLDWFGLYPLGELVHRDKQMGHATSRCFEWPHHVQAPDSKGPGNVNSLERKSQLMWLGTKLLAPFSFLDQFIGVFKRSRPEEAMEEGFGNECS